MFGPFCRPGSGTVRDGGLESASNTLTASLADRKSNLLLTPDTPGAGVATFRRQQSFHARLDVAQPRESVHNPRLVLQFRQGTQLPVHVLPVDLGITS